jgi:hypothetical protein
MRRYADLKIKKYTQEEARQVTSVLPQRVAKVGVLSRGGTRIPMRKGYFYSTACGLRGDIWDLEPGSPSYGCPRGNDNGDFFYFKEELLSLKTRGRHAGKRTFKTWEGCPVLENHSPNNERGIIEKSYPVFEDKSIDMVMAVDMNRFADLCHALGNGEICDVSMGCDLAWSTCSHCGASSYSDEDWCEDLQLYKGRRHPRTGRFVAEILHDVSGVELSIISNGCGADPEAELRDILFMPDLSRRGRKAAEDMMQAYYRKILGIKK